MIDRVDRQAKAILQALKVPLETLDVEASPEKVDRLGNRLFQPSHENEVIRKERIASLQKLLAPDTTVLTPRERAIIFWHFGMLKNDEHEYTIQEIADHMLGITHQSVRDSYNRAMRKLKRALTYPGQIKEKVGGDLSEFGDA